MSPAPNSPAQPKRNDGRTFQIRLIGGSARKATRQFVLMITLS
jgi:hypothetical protein